MIFLIVFRFVNATKMCTHSSCQKCDQFFSGEDFFNSKIVDISRFILSNWSAATFVHLSKNMIFITFKQHIHRIATFVKNLRAFVSSWFDSPLPVIPIIIMMLTIQLKTCFRVQLIPGYIRLCRFQQYSTPERFPAKLL